jgi:ribosomal protein S18 acetylase RimI-like enzyme
MRINCSNSPSPKWRFARDRSSALWRCELKWRAYDVGMRIENLDESFVTPVRTLWEVSGLTRPWNNPDRDYLDAIDGPASGVLGALGDSGLIGTVMVGYDGHRGWVYYLAVSPDHRNQGVGRALMESAENWLREHGARKLQLMVRHTNESVISFYDRLGYEDAETVVLAKWLEQS